MAETDGTGKTDDKGETETGEITQTDDRDQTDGRNIESVKDKTKIEKCVEETVRMDDLKDEEKCRKEGNIGKNGEKRIVRWKDVVGNPEEGCSSGSSEGIPNDTDPENPRLARDVGTEQGTEALSALESWKAAFNWNDFFYSLILGFLPTAWDVFSQSCKMSNFLHTDQIFQPNFYPKENA